MSEVVRLGASLDGPPAAPVLVLGNSLGTSSVLWEPQLRALSAHFRLLRYEHRGHGQIGGKFSPGPPGPYTIGELGGDVLALLDHIGVDRALYCGVSLGGMIGMWLAATAPDRIAGLILCCTSAHLPPAQAWHQRAAVVRAHGPGSIAAQVVGRWFTPAFAAAEPSIVASFQSALAQMSAEGYAACCEAIAEMDQRPMLAQISAPTLVIAGADDPATPPWQAGVMASRIPRARLKVIRGAAHLANVSNAGEVSAALVQHLRGLT